MRILHVNGFSEEYVWFKLFFRMRFNDFFLHREKRQKIEDIKKNIRDAILVCLNIVEWHWTVNIWFALQTITGAMSTLVPPVQLENPDHQWRVDYIQDIASNPDFDYPPVCLHFILITLWFYPSFLFVLRNFTNIQKYYGKIEVYRLLSSDRTSINW